MNYLYCVDLLLMGFEQAIYSVDEEAGSVSLCVTIGNGLVQRSVAIVFETASGSAQG